MGWLFNTALLVGLLWYVTQRVWLIIGPRARHIGQEDDGWTVITGATDGLGKAVCLRIAAQSPRSKIAIIGRNDDKLKATADEIRRVPNFKGELRQMKMDLAEGTFADQQQAVREYFKGLKIGVLICNAGISYDSPKYFGELDPMMAKRMINVNLQSLMAFIYVIIGQMRERKSGVIICTGSASRIAGDPMHQAYCTSKGAVAAFCNSLQSEVRPDGVLIQCLEYGYIRTKLAALYHKALGAMEADDAARWMLHVAERGIAEGYFVTPTTFSPDPLHMLVLELIPWIPTQIWERMRFRARLNARSRAQKIQ